MIVKKITYFKGKGVFEMSRFTLPRDIYHGKGCLEELKNLKGKKAILVVGGGSMKRQGFLDRAENYLKEAGMEVKLFEGVEPDPSVETVMKGAAVMQEFQPDWTIDMVASVCAISAVRSLKIEILPTAEVVSVDVYRLV